MTSARLVSALHEMDVRVFLAAGAVKLAVDSGDVPQRAIDLAKPQKAELLVYLSSNRCNCGELMTPFGLAVQGWRNWDCFACGAVRPVREVAQ